MRSRYTAYTMGEVDYIVETHVPDGRDSVDRDGAAKWAEESTWDGLEIVTTEAGGPDDDEGMVEFIARYSMEGAGFVHHERSTFKKIDGRWYYEDGEMVKKQPKRRETPKVGRNEPCPCGSGKKYKKCHGKN
jgi:SEC-C motif-containing protein